MQSVSTIKQVIDILYKDGFVDDAEELEALCEVLHSGQVKEAIEAAEDIKSLCHVRILRDLNIKAVSRIEWGRLITKLSQYANKKINKLNSENLIKKNN